MTRAHPRVGPLVARTTVAALDVDALIDDPRTGIIVCCGSGGVGKTTTSAALALRAAERGRKVVVLTIDPARRLAQSMGIEALDNTPRPVTGVGGAGSLDAMMLDMKRTFDEVVEAQATPEKAKQILENPFYIALSSSFAGTQEYMAMEKLGQLQRDASAAGTYDLIVVDTPPSRSALDFLDAPERLSSFLDGRFVRMLLAPARGPARIMTAGFGLVTGALSKILGGQFITDLQTFVTALDTVFGGFRARAAADLRAPAGARHGVPRRGGSGGRRAARGGVLRRAAQRGPDAARRVGREPRQPGRAGIALGGRGDGGVRAAAAGGAVAHGPAHRGAAAAARGPGADGRAGGGAAAAVRGGAPERRDGRRAGAGRRRARPRRPPPDRRAARRPGVRSAPRSGEQRPRRPPVVLPRVASGRLGRVRPTWPVQLRHAISGRFLGSPPPAPPLFGLPPGGSMVPND